MQKLFKPFCAFQGDRLIYKMDGRRLRVLCYHGVCEDRLANEPWMPDYFVTKSALEEQLQYLTRHTRILPLSEAVRRLGDGTLPPRSPSITFDDGYANNVSLAYPLLQKYSAPATIFLSTAYIESGEMYPFLKLKLIQLTLGAELKPDALLEYKSTPLDQVTERADRWWSVVKSRLSSDQWTALKPLKIVEVGAADSKLVEFGAHSHTHCILKNESRERRRDEIQISIQKVGQWTGRPVSLFSYPNGQRSDFGEGDIEVLKAEGIRAAVTGIPGANNLSVDPLRLRRYPIGLWHGAAVFPAEVSGFRTALLAIPRRLRNAN